MNYAFFSLLVLFSCAPVFASEVTIECNGTYTWDDSTVENAHMSASVASDTRLENVSFLRTISPQDKPKRFSVVEADAAYKPRNQKYAEMNRFSLGQGGWSNDKVLLPKTIPTTGSFAVYFQSTGHDSGPTITGTCSVTN